VLVAADVAGGAVALAAVRIDRDQCLVVVVVDRGQVVELAAREPRLRGEEAQEDRLGAGAEEALVEPIPVVGPDRPDQRAGPVAEPADRPPATRPAPPATWPRRSRRRERPRR